jgi:hypothetical protein
MENSIAYPAENPNTGNSSQLQPMKPFIWAPAIPTPVNFRNLFFLPG